MTTSIYQNPFVFEKHGPHFSDYIALCIKHHKDEKGQNTEFHHIFPEHKGGTNDRWNKVHLEYELHVEAHRLLMEAFRDEKQMKQAFNQTKNRGSMRGENNPMFGNGHLVIGENNPMFGKTYTHTEEAIQKMREAKTGKNHPMFGKTPWNKGKTSGMRDTKHKRVICEHCGKDVAVNDYGRNHGDKCKHKSS